MKKNYYRIVMISREYHCRDYVTYYPKDGISWNSEWDGRYYDTFPGEWIEEILAEAKDAYGKEAIVIAETVDW